MKNLKELLANTLGWVGIVLWYVVSFLLMFLPLAVLNFPFWIDLIIIFVVLNIQGIGDMIALVLWVWSFIEIVSEPIDGWSIFYFVILAINVLLAVLPSIIGIIATIIEDRKDK